MNIELAGSNVIVAAAQFNPTVFSQLWFIRNGVLTEEDFGPDFLFSEAIVQIVTPQFFLLVMPSQIQFNFNPNSRVEDQQALIQEKLGRIVERLPHTPYVAVGLNIVWHLRDSMAGIKQLSRELFFRDDSDLYRGFDTEDAQFGAYLSRDFDGCRQKLDIKPVAHSSDSGDMQRLQFAFNFHRDLTDGVEPVRRIQEMLGRWNEVTAESRRIVESLQKGAVK